MSICAMDSSSLSGVAPHGGAWIEIMRGTICPCRRLGSPLTEGRGLKFSGASLSPSQLWSPLTEGRGLKFPYRLGHRPG